MRSTLPFQKSKESEAEFCNKQKIFFPHPMCVGFLCYLRDLKQSHPDFFYHLQQIPSTIAVRMLHPHLHINPNQFGLLQSMYLLWMNTYSDWGTSNRFDHNHGTIKVQVQMGDTRSKYLISFECPCPPLVKCIALFSLQSQNPLREYIFFSVPDFFLSLGVRLRRNVLGHTLNQVEF